MGLSKTGPQKSNITQYNGTALSGNLNAVIANFSGLITQINNAFIANGSNTGSSNLPIPITTSKPYWIAILGVSTDASNAARTARLTSFNGTQLNFTRTDTGGSAPDTLTVQYVVVGTPA